MHQTNKSRMNNNIRYTTGRPTAVSSIVLLFLSLFLTTQATADSQSIKNHFAEAKRQINQGDLRAAEQQLIALLNNNPQLAPVRAELASVQTDLGKYQQAIGHLNTLLALKDLPDNVRHRLKKLKTRAKQKFQQQNTSRHHFSGALQVSAGHDTKPILNVINGVDTDGFAMSSSPLMPNSKGRKQIARELKHLSTSDTWIADLVSEPLNFFSYPCGRQNSPLESCAQVVDGVEALGISAVSFSEQGLIDINGNFHSYREISTQLPQNRKNVFQDSSNFVSEKITLRHSYHPEDHRFQWRNEVSFQHQKLDGENTQQLRFNSVLDYRINTDWIFSTRIDYDRYNNNSQEIAEYKSISPELTYLSNLGSISLSYSWLDKKYSQKFFPHLNADDEGLELSWTNQFLDDKLLLTASYSSIENKRTKHDYITTRNGSQNIAQSISGLYQFSDTTKGYFSIEKNRLAVGGIKAQQLYQFSATIDHQLSPGWYGFIAYEHDHIDENLIYSELSRNVYQIGVRWQF